MLNNTIQITLDDDDEEQLKEAPKKETNFQKNRLEVRMVL